MKTQDKWKRWIDVLFAVALGIERVDFLFFNRRLLLYFHIEYSKRDSKCTVFGEIHGKVKFGSLMGALKLVRTSSKLAHFDAQFLHNV